MTCLNCLFFFFNDTATTEIYTLSLHDALPICLDVGDHGISKGVYRALAVDGSLEGVRLPLRADLLGFGPDTDRKSTRLNSSHANISYAVFCLKKKRTHGS